MNNTEIPAMFLKLNGKWGYEQYGNTNHVFKTKCKMRLWTTEIPAMFLKLNGKWGYEQYGNTNHVLKLTGKWGYDNTEIPTMFKTKWKMRLWTIRKYQACF